MSSTTKALSVLTGIFAGLAKKKQEKIDKDLANQKKKTRLLNDEAVHLQNQQREAAMAIQKTNQAAKVEERVREAAIVERFRKRNEAIRNEPGFGSPTAVGPPQPGFAGRLQQSGLSQPTRAEVSQAGMDPNQILGKLPTPPTPVDPELLKRFGGGGGNLAPGQGISVGPRGATFSQTGQRSLPRIGAEAKVRAEATTEARIQGKAREALAGFGPLEVIVTQLEQDANALITATTPLEALKQRIQLTAGALTKSNPVAAAYEDSKEAFLDQVARTLGGARGVLTDKDIERLGRIFVTFGDTVATKDLKQQKLREILKAAVAVQRKLASPR